MAPHGTESDGSTLRWQRSVLDFVKDHPSSINIFWCSAYQVAYNETQLNDWILFEDVLDLRNEKNFLIYAMATNIETNQDGVLINQICNSEYACGEHGCYSLASLANSDKNSNPSSHVFVTVANQANGNIDQTNETITSTKFPVGFANNDLFS